MSKILEVVHGGIDPYKDFDDSKYELDLQGWNGDSALITRLVEEIKPTMSCEVGSWKGMSAANIARTMKRVSPPGSDLVCVDTWLGAKEFYMWRGTASEPLRNLMLVNGYPSVYYQFLANMKKLGLHDIVYPFPITSQIAAEAFTEWKLEFDFIYVDASHEYRHVKEDIEAYWRLLRSGGVLSGDDYGGFWTGVTHAVDEFAKLFSLSIERDPCSTWAVRKP